MHRSRAATAAAFAALLLVAGLAAPAAAHPEPQNGAAPALAAAARAAKALPRRFLGELRAHAGHAGHRHRDGDGGNGGFDGNFGPGERYESFMTGAGPYFGGIPRYAYGATGYAPAYVNRYGGQTAWTGWDWRR